MKRWLRAPLLHFALLGTLLFAAEQLLPRQPEEILLSPGPNLQTRADEEMLLREALAQGLDRRDSVARERLLLNMRFAFPDRDASEAQMLEEARRLGMHRRDHVVRLRLCERMRQQLRAGAALRESDIAAQLQRAHLVPAVRYAFQQKFFSHARASAESRAMAALARLSAGHPVHSDGFALGERTAPATRGEIQRRYGAAFAQAIAQTPVGDWSGPFASPFGWHLVKLEDVLAPSGTGGEWRTQAAYVALAEREQVALSMGLAALRQRYRVRIDTPT